MRPQRPRHCYTIWHCMCRQGTGAWGRRYKEAFPGNELGLSLTWGRKHWFGVEVQVCHSLGIVANSRRVRWAFLLGFTKLFGILWYKIVSVDILAYNSVFHLWGTKVYYLKPGVFYPLPLYWVYILAVHIFSVVDALLLFIIWNIEKWEVSEKLRKTEW